MTLSRIEPATFRLVAQCLKLLRHRVPHYTRYRYKTLSGKWLSVTGTLFTALSVPSVHIGVISGTRDVLTS